MERQEDVRRANREKERSGSGWHVMKGDIDRVYCEEREKSRREGIKSDGERRTERSQWAKGMRRRGRRKARTSKR